MFFPCTNVPRGWNAEFLELNLAYAYLCVFKGLVLFHKFTGLLYRMCWDFFFTNSGWMFYPFLYSCSLQYFFFFVIQWLLSKYNNVQYMTRGLCFGMRCYSCSLSFEFYGEASLGNLILKSELSFTHTRVHTVLKVCWTGPKWSIKNFASIASIRVNSSSAFGGDMHRGWHVEDACSYNEGLSCQFDNWYSK